jgi:electron transfer flavoprotein beta subunit
MHSVVCLKQVPDVTEVKIDPETNTLVRVGVPSITNPYDVNALEEALKLKDKFGGKVTVITMGPQMAEEILNKAVGMGADEGILLSDRSFAGADTLATSYVLSMAIKKISEKEKVDLVFCGKQAIDGDTAQVGPGIAARLSYTLLTYIDSIEELRPEDDYIRVKRKVKAGYEITESKLPLVLTTNRDINEIRYESLPDLIKAAKYKPLVWGKEELNLDTQKLGLKGSPTMVREIFPPLQRECGEKIIFTDENADSVVEDLVQRLIPGIIIPN